MDNRYYIVKLKSSEFGDKFVYGFKDGYSSNQVGGTDLFCIDDKVFLIECPADAISVCMLINSKF